MAELGVQTVRYGIPWHRISPAPGQWDWTWADGPIERLLASGIHPIVDLVHYGAPAWIEGAWANPGLPDHMAEYAARAAERFQGRVRRWTPLNEPRITAWGCGMSGLWPPGRRGWRGFVGVLLAVCRATVLAGKALRAADPQNVIVAMDAANRWLPPQPAEPALVAATEFRRNLAFLALDLTAGRVDRGPPPVALAAPTGRRRAGIGLVRGAPGDAGRHRPQSLPDALPKAVGADGVRAGAHPVSLRVGGDGGTGRDRLLGALSLPSADRRNCGPRPGGAAAGLAARVG